MHNLIILSTLSSFAPFFFRFSIHRGENILPGKIAVLQVIDILSYKQAGLSDTAQYRKHTDISK